MTLHLLDQGALTVEVVIRLSQVQRVLVVGDLPRRLQRLGQRPQPRAPWRHRRRSGRRASRPVRRRSPVGAVAVVAVAGPAAAALALRRLVEQVNDSEAERRGQVLLVPLAAEAPQAGATLRGAVRHNLTDTFL